MNIVRENLDNQTALLKVSVGEQDYTEAVDKALRNYRKKANVPGFRPGMVPMGIINKMYRKSTVAEEAYRVATKASVDNLNESNTKTLGELMPSSKQEPIDFENSTEFEFLFEIGIAPEVNIELDKKEDKVTKYSIKIADDMTSGYKENYLRRFGKLEDVDVVSKDEALTVTLDQEEMKIEEAYVGLVGMSEEERAPFIGKKVWDKMEVNVNELYKTPSQRASILGVKEDELDGINPEFSLEITKIRQFITSELNEEFFKMAFPEGNVNNEDEFNKYVEQQIESELSRETDYKFAIDVKDYLLKKANLSLPEEFLKNWLYAVNDGKFSKEDIEKEFPAFADMMRWYLIQRYFVEKLNLEVTQDELKEEAKAMAAMQFAYYGMPSVADDMLENYAEQILSNKEELKKIHDKVFEKKIVDAASENLSISKKKISAEDFNKLFQ
ncbi:MAG: trigger factor [Rikenellaceae bacterium]|nr:trigger factor [Rikenellaceae bacterium]